MTLLDGGPALELGQRRPPAGQSPSVLPTWRLALRLAWRETRRRPGRTALAATLIAVPVAAMTIGSVLLRTEDGDWSAQFERRYGTADIALDPRIFAMPEDGGDVEQRVEAALPDRSRRSQFFAVSATIMLREPAPAGVTYSWMTLYDAVPPGVEVIEGAAPAPGEALLDTATASAWDVGVGDAVELEHPSGRWLVSGIGRDRDQYDDRLIILPGFDRRRVIAGVGSVSTLIDLPTDTTATATRDLAAQLPGVTRYDDPYFAGPGELGRGLTWGWVGGTLALALAGIVVAAAFATSARRQLVTIGQLASNGATPAVVRRTLALQGGWTGLIGAIAGTAVGLIAVPLGRPLIEPTFLRHDMSPIEVSLGDLVIIVVTAVAVAIVAAGVPARMAARIPVMAALAGRRPLAEVPRRLVPVGTALVVGGLGLCALAALGIDASDTRSGDDAFALAIVVGAVALAVGLICVTPIVVERLGEMGARSRLDWRLALRSLGRARPRSVAVVSAIAVTVGGSMCAAMVLEAAIQQRLVARPVLAADAVVMQFQQVLPSGDGVVDLPALEPAAVPADLRQAVDAIVPGAEASVLRRATVDPPAVDLTQHEGAPPNPVGPLVADPSTLDLIGLSEPDRATLDAAGVIIVDNDGAGQQGAGQQGDGQSSDPALACPGCWQYLAASGAISLDPASSIDPTPTSFGAQGELLITEAHARSLGFDIVPVGLILRSGQPLTAERIDRLQALQERLNPDFGNVFVEPGEPTAAYDPQQGGLVVESYWWASYDDPRWREADEQALWVARGVIAVGVLLLTAVVVAIGLALAAAESRDERNVLMVLGARPASIRRQAAARAVVLTICGVALGIPAGFVPTWLVGRIAQGDDPFTTPLRFPWTIAIGNALLVPVLIGLGTWAGSGIAHRLRPASPARRD